MIIETTIRVGRDAAARIEEISAGRGVSKSALVSGLVRFASRKMAPLPEGWIRVKYQKPRVKKEWHCLHLSLKPDEYEFFGDMRKVQRLSVSFIVAIAVEYFLAEMLECLGDDTDNYRYRNYIIARFILGDVVCWVHCWGIPPGMTREEP